MSVLFAEGFTGVARGSSSPVAVGSAFILTPLGWVGNALYNGSQVVGATDTNHSTTIEADPIFASRNRLSAKATLVGAVTSYIQQYRIPVDTRGYTKYVIGMVFNMDTTTTTAGAIQFIVAGPAAWTSTGATAPEQYIGLNIPDNGADGFPWMFWGAGGATTPLIKKGKTTHMELLIEEDVDRVRVYLDGTLIGDASYSGTFGSLNGGFSVLMRTQASIVTTITMKVSDVYLLGLDTVHTAKLGPSTRVMEVAPKTDVDVNFNRQGDFASNAAVLAQYFATGNPGLLTSGTIGAYDIYNAPDTVAANAAQIYGAGLRTYAMSMAEGSHAIKPAVKTATGVKETGKEIPLLLGNFLPGFADMSINPDTSSIWTPTELRNVGFGLKLIR